MGLTSRARGASMRVAILIAAGLALSLLSASTVNAAEILKHGSAPPPISKVPAGPQGFGGVDFEVVAQPAGEGFWTRERLLSARPAELRLPPIAPSATSGEAMPDMELPKPAGDASASAATGDFTPRNVTAYPRRIHGKIFFTIGPNAYSCSGTVIDSRKRNVVFTAGHCVYDFATQTYVSNLVFLPGYRNGEALGTYHATKVGTTTAWQSQAEHSYDLGIIELDQRIESRYGSRQIAFDLKPRGRAVTIYGYPSAPSSLYDGEILRGCHSEITHRDNTKTAPYPIGASPCRMQQGASGGGWIVLGNYVNSVVSYGYCDEVPRLCGVILGPYFSNAAKALYELAGGSPAPIIRLRHRPPRVVHKRRVRFSFAGRAATLIGFRCKLDRQRAVACSSRISINRLRPGRHTLRVRAIDQTGHRSRMITRRFWVAPKRRHRRAAKRNPRLVSSHGSRFAPKGGLRIAPGRRSRR